MRVLCHAVCDRGDEAGRLRTLVYPFARTAISEASQSILESVAKFLTAATVLYRTKRNIDLDQSFRIT